MYPQYLTLTLAGKNNEQKHWPKLNIVDMLENALLVHIFGYI